MLFSGRGNYYLSCQDDRPLTQVILLFLIRNNLDLNGNIIGSTASASSLASAVMSGDISALGGALPGFRREIEEPRKLNNMYLNEETPSKKNLLLFIVGGVTLLEIAAFRFLSYEPNFPYRIVIASTKLMNGSNFLTQLQHS